MYASWEDHGQVADMGIVDNPTIAARAIPGCNLVCITGAEMQAALEGYYGVLFAAVLDPTRPGYRIVLDHEEQSFTDANGSGIRTLTHRKILDAGGWLVKDEILNARLSDGSYAMDTYYTKG